MRVFFDTNVWLSAALFPGLCSELLLRCVEEGHVLLTSTLVRAEAVAVLAEKFPWRDDAPALFEAVWQAAECVADVAPAEEDADARLVAAAVEAGAGLFVTGDMRVQSWEQSGGMRIVSPRQAWETLFGSSPA
ncbi:MAG: putative toxin-antitoxin system toxin component, PIN family [Thiobacillus sp.]